MRELFDAEPIHGPSSTDANIPLAAGIPAICVSAAVGRGCHTRQEEIDLDQLPNGAEAVDAADAGTSRSERYTQGRNAEFCASGLI